LSDLSRTLVGTIGDLMHVRQVGILLVHDDPRIARGDVTGVSLAAWSGFSDRAADVLQILQPILTGDERFMVDYFPEKIRNEILKLGFRRVIPVRSQNRLLAVLFIGEKLSETPFYQEDFLFLQAIARQAAVSMENSFLYEELAHRERLNREMEIARHIQLASLPHEIPQWPGLQIAGVSQPAQEVGGDYYDFLDSDSTRRLVIVGDVSGKGISAALYMSKMQGILRSLYDFDLTPQELFVRLNEVLGRDMDKAFFVTALAAEIQPEHQRLLVARAGHLPLFHFQNQSGQVQLLTPRGIGFGLDQNGLFKKELEIAAVDYAIGDVFLFVTDGITEARDLQNVEFGENQLQEVLQRHAAEPAAEICRQVLQQAHDFSGRPTPLDDQTVVVVKAI
jgi:phosphoserine phosphatase RsbU/P